MQSNTRKPEPVRPRPSSVRFGGERKQVRKVHTRKLPYRVGYCWNKGGRLKELRIRHLARKFLKIWMQNTFGRLLPHKAKSHYDTVVLRRVFAEWRDEWWTSRREWSLTLRAECHRRYYLYNLVFQNWQTFTSLQRGKRSKVQAAQSFADRQQMRLVLERWKVFTETRRINNRMLESTLEHSRRATLHSAWRLWRARLQRHRDLQALEDQALKQRALTLQRRILLHWKEMHTAACCQKEKESKAALHFILLLKRKTLNRWKCYVSTLQTKKKSQAVAQRARHLRLLAMCWRKWSSALHRKRSGEDRLQAAGLLAVRVTQRRALERWKALDVTLCREEAERNRIVSHAHRHQLLHVGLQGLLLHVNRNKAHRLNSNMAVQHYHQSMTRNYWRLWQDRLEEAEDESFRPLYEMAMTNHSTSLLRRCFHHWRKNLRKQRHMKELEHRADVWFAEGALPKCFTLWAEITSQQRRFKQMKHKAEVFNRQRRYTSVFYTWRGRAEEHRERTLCERMAILHEERCRLHRAWTSWRRRTERNINDREKQEASDRLYLHRLLHKTMTRWKDSSSEMRDRRNRELQACRQGDLRCVRLAVEKWKKFVQCQRMKTAKLKRMQRYREVKLLMHTFVAWKEHLLERGQIYGHVEELYWQHKRTFLRKVLCVWRENAALQTEVRLKEQRAQSHFQHSLRLKVFLAWREATACAASKRHQQREAVNKAQRSMNQVRLLQSFRRWKTQSRKARGERMCMEKARRHHGSKLLSKAVKAWKEHHNHILKSKVMKRQGILLLRLKMYQMYFDQWKIKLQHRRREANQTERALWHWSLTLQAKVLHGWRLQVTEQRRKQEQAARAAQVYRDQLLREGVTCILTYAAHMSDLTTSLTQHSQEQRSRHLHRVVKRCAMRWKRRALCKPKTELEVKVQSPQKSVTFCLASCGSKGEPPSAPKEQEAEDGGQSKLLLGRAPRRQPRRCEDLFESLVKINTQSQSTRCGAEAPPKASLVHCPAEGDRRTATACLRPPSTRQSGVPSNPSPSGPNMSAVGFPRERQSQDALLPPSAFMTSVTRDLMGKTYSSCFGEAPHQFVPLFEQHPSADSGVRQRATSALTGELLRIQLDMVTYQQDRKQLRAWQRLKEVLKSWLHTSGKEEEMEKNAVCQELKELEERIDGLSAELAERKPTMLLHAKRIQLIQKTLFHQKTEEMETDCSVFTTLSA
ncbi:protein SFI1 homolog isoform X1 [Gasterosteus aculeatus]